MVRSTLPLPSRSACTVLARPFAFSVVIVLSRSVLLPLRSRWLMTELPSALTTMLDTVVSSMMPSPLRSVVVVCRCRSALLVVTVLSRSRLEDEQFRKWIQTNTPDWISVWDRPHPRYAEGPRDKWFVYRGPLPSAEGWPVVWVWSTLLTLRQEARRQRNIAAASEDLAELRQRLAGARTRLRRAADIDFQIRTILEKYHVARYVKVERTVREDHIYKQARRGRPGPSTVYRKITKRRFDIEWTIDEEAVAYDHKSDGMYPLITNDRGMSPAQVLEAHKAQPMIEKRFEQIKTVHEIAPVLLKNEGRIEALFTLYFLALLVQAIIERELRFSMKRENIAELPLYPEQRSCAHPTTEQILRLFSLAERHQLMHDGKAVEVFDVQFTELQRHVLKLMGVSEHAFRLPR